MVYIESEGSARHAPLANLWRVLQLPSKLQRKDGNMPASGYCLCHVFERSIRSFTSLRRTSGLCAFRYLPIIQRLRVVSLFPYWRRSFVLRRSPKFGTEAFNCRCRRHGCAQHARAYLLQNGSSFQRILVGYETTVLGSTMFTSSTCMNVVRRSPIEYTMPSWFDPFGHKSDTGDG